MKVVINRCFGGFGLSMAAVKRVAELQGRPCYFFQPTFKVGESRAYVPLSDETRDRFLFWVAFDIPNPNEVVGAANNWGAMSQAERADHNANYEVHSIESGRAWNRNDPLLLQVVEELGEAASADLAKLAIVEVPDEVEWEIDEYDGMETVEEKHRSWA